MADKQDEKAVEARGLVASLEKLVKLMDGLEITYDPYTGQHAISSIFFVATEKAIRPLKVRIRDFAVALTKYPGLSPLTVERHKAFVGWAWTALRRDIPQYERRELVTSEQLGKPVVVVDPVEIDRRLSETLDSFFYHDIPGSGKLTIADIGTSRAWTGIYGALPRTIFAYDGSSWPQFAVSAQYTPEEWTDLQTIHFQAYLDWAGDFSLG